ncbi:MAG: lysylphosphatidylglycerol synthase transmembrane domain-containing protein [Terriglobales bacterium]
MKTKNIFIYAAVLAVLLALIYLQFRSWRNFDWDTFWSQTGQVNKVEVAAGLILIYLAYGLRALRWKIFLRPVRHTTTVELMNPTIIGFAGLALLGRAGEMIRPYLIARKVGLPFSSQIAVWAVERIFDVGAFAILLISAIFFADAPRHLSYYERFREGGLFIIVVVAGLICGVFLVALKGEAVADWVERRFSHLASNLGHHIALRIREFRSGLNTIHDFAALIQLIAVSLAMWSMIALAYWEVMQSYGTESLSRPLADVPLLMASSMVGSMIQLPGVGGVSQLATIGTLQYVFRASHELAASCGILLWLVTFVSIVPLGLALAHRERLSLRRLSDESHLNEESEIARSPS